MKPCVYKITRNDDLEYIGITTNLNDRIYRHSKSKRFKEGIKTVEVLEDFSTYQEAELKEEFYIQKYNTYRYGLNITPDGKGKNKDTKFSTFGMKHSSETKKKIGLRTKNRPNGMLGKKHSKSTKESWSKLRKGKVWGPVKFRESKVRDILNLYATSPSISGVGETQKNGKKLPYDSAFAKKYHKEFNCTKAWLTKLLRGKFITWNPLVNKILNTKY